MTSWPTCRRFRVLNIVDDHSRFWPGKIVDVSISGARVTRYLDDLALLHGLPEEIVLDEQELVRQLGEKLYGKRPETAHG